MEVQKFIFPIVFWEKQGFHQVIGRRSDLSGAHMGTQLSDKLSHSRYSSLCNDEAVKLAHHDLMTAVDHQGALPTGSLRDYVCKMFASDVLRVAAMWTPKLITDAIVADCQKVFPACNASTRLNIIIIFGLLRRKDTVPFLEGVRDDPLRLNAWRLVERSGKFFQEYYKDDKKTDEESEAADEAIQVIDGKLGIADGVIPGRYIYTLNAE